jgi:hypothetical protein
LKGIYLDPSEAAALDEAEEGSGAVMQNLASGLPYEYTKVGRIHIFGIARRFLL